MGTEGECDGVCRERTESGIVFENVGFSRGSRTVFAALSLSLLEQRIGLVGDNGSGKSTLLRLMNGLLSPNSGRIIVNGIDTIEQRRKLPAEIGFVFQNPDHQILFPTVAEEITFGLEESGLDAASARERALGVLASNGCEGWAERAIHELSDGQKQLLCILAVVAPEPSIILLDEPFANLDLPTRLSLAARLEALPQRIIMASHDLDLLAGFDRVIWLEEGRVRDDGAPDEILACYRAHARTRAVLIAGREAL